MLHETQKRMIDVALAIRSDAQVEADKAKFKAVFTNGDSPRADVARAMYDYVCSVRGTEVRKSGDKDAKE